MDAPFHSSGALSRRHYAIVKKVESATTTAAADQEIILEIKSLKNDIQDPRLSTVSGRRSGQRKANLWLGSEEGVSHYSPVLCQSALDDNPSSQRF